MAIKNELQIEYLPTEQLKDYDRQLRKPSKNQKEKAVKLIEHSGINIPIAIDKDKNVVIGHIFVEAARALNIDEVPVVRLDHLSEAQIKVLRIAYDRVSADAEWDQEALALEFEELELLIPEIDLTITGFEIAEIEGAMDFSLSEDSQDDEIPEVEQAVVTKSGDIWQLGRHRLLCGSALNDEDYKTLMQEELAQAVFTDPPYNVKVDGHVCGKGKVKHDEFAMASGEMSEEEFIAFLLAAIKLMIAHSADGSLHYMCMDWRHIYELISAGKQHYTEMKNICVWNKDNGGMGSLYRSKHELVAVFKNGKKPHINNVQLGQHGRYRTNVWDYAGVNSFRNKDDLKMHPTVKPVAMIADAIKDCTKRDHIVLDPFAGSGSTLIACEKIVRQARCIELEPKYCDVIVRRWQALTGQDAVHAETGKTFNETQNELGDSNE